MNTLLILLGRPSGKRYFAPSAEDVLALAVVSPSLEIHHKTYLVSKLPWEYPTANFEVLCEEHHCERHTIPYVQNKCRDCGKVIKSSYETCIPCRNKGHREQATKLDEQATELEQQATELKRLNGKVVAIEGGRSNNKNREQALELEQQATKLEP